jgi:hypothetical protein
MPVVSEIDGSLVDVISIRDITLVGNFRVPFIDRLWLTCEEYKKLMKQESVEKTSIAPLFVTGDDTFGGILTRMFDGNIHRVIVCDLDAAAVKMFPTHIICKT